MRNTHGGEVVSLAGMLDAETARGGAVGAAIAKALRCGPVVADDVVLHVLRHWFWSLRPARGFIVNGFPATVAQAAVFDAWLEERDSTLAAVVWVDQTLDQASALAETAEERARLAAWFAGHGAAAGRVAAHYRRQGNLLRVDGSLAVFQALELLSEQLRGRIADR
jgi:adenylate kinase